MKISAQQKLENLEMQLIRNPKEKSHLVAAPILRVVVKMATDAERFKSEQKLADNTIRYYKEKAASADAENARLRAENADLEKLLQLRG